MILYHGTFVEFQTIKLEKCRPYKDFGKGFYLTDFEEQAVKMAEKKAKIFNGTPIILRYEFDEQLLIRGELKVMRFSKANLEWAEFIYKNRSRSCEFQYTLTFPHTSVRPLSLSDFGLCLYIHFFDFFVRRA